MSDASTVPKLAFRIDEAVAATGISRAALYQDIAEGKLRARKRGASTLILAADLQSYLENFPEAA
jgi:excisionase family DNA binding protein